MCKTSDDWQNNHSAARTLWKPHFYFDIIHALSPHSPDLNPLDFWFSGTAKCKSYRNHPNTLEDLKENILYNVAFWDVELI